jgi:hypothetical protein
LPLSTMYDSEPVCALTGEPVAVERAAHSLLRQPEERNHGVERLIWSCDFHDR